jgi:hypothetical protein
MDDETQIDVPTNHADALRRLAAILRDRDQARQSNDPQQQRALRQLAHERLEQLMSELFPEVYAAVNEAAAVTRDMVEREPDRAGYPMPKHRTYSMPLLRNNPEAADEASAILAHFLTKAAPRLPPGLGEAAASALWLMHMGEATWLGSRTAPDGGRIAFRNRILFGLVHYEWGFNREQPHQTIGKATERNKGQKAHPRLRRISVYNASSLPAR